MEQALLGSAGTGESPSNIYFRGANGGSAQKSTYHSLDVQELDSKKGYYNGQSIHSRRANAKCVRLEESK